MTARITDLSATRGASPATIRARRPSGMLDTFYAEHAVARDGFIIAIGHWCGSRRRGQHAWPASRVVEVAWADEAVAV